MVEQIVSFDLAKLLKSIGFEEECFYAYYEELQQGIIESAYEYTGELTFSIGDINNAYNNGFICYLAPSQSFAQKYLREKYSISVLIKQYNSGKFSYIIYKKVEDKEWVIISNSLNHFPFNTYEIALEEGLKEGVNIIKI